MYMSNTVSHSVSSVGSPDWDIHRACKENLAQKVLRLFCKRSFTYRDQDRVIDELTRKLFDCMRELEGLKQSQALDKQQRQERRATRQHSRQPSASSRSSRGSKQSVSTVDQQLTAIHSKYVPRPLHESESPTPDSASPNTPLSTESMHIARSPVQPTTSPHSGRVRFSPTRQRVSINDVRPLLELGYAATTEQSEHRSTGEARIVTVKTAQDRIRAPAATSTKLVVNSVPAPKVSFEDPFSPVASPISHPITDVKQAKSAHHMTPIVMSPPHAARTPLRDTAEEKAKQEQVEFLANEGIAHVTKADLTPPPATPEQRNKIMQSLAVLEENQMKRLRNLATKQLTKSPGAQQHSPSGTPSSVMPARRGGAMQFLQQLGLATDSSPAAPGSAGVATMKRHEQDEQHASPASSQSSAPVVPAKRGGAMQLLQQLGIVAKSANTTRPVSAAVVTQLQERKYEQLRTRTPPAKPFSLRNAPQTPALPRAMSQTPSQHFMATGLDANEHVRQAAIYEQVQSLIREKVDRSFSKANEHLQEHQRRREQEKQCETPVRLTGLGRPSSAPKQRPSPARRQLFRP